ncbi:MAG: pentapeptide repeat-containing protein [Fidelibacterota bacterium]|nr:MAG: pentapeptide repeat-containing protein [Candidatus Neomarinimicrobiota bacterium]
MPLEKELPGSWSDKRSTIPSWAVVFVWLFYVEWLMEWVAYWFSRWALIEILGYIARFSILVAVIAYFAGADDRRQQAEDQRKTKHYQAWQVINAAHGKPGDGGRTDALQDLNRDRISLYRIDLSGAILGGTSEDALWIGVDLPGAKLSEAVLRRTVMSRANLREARMSYCDLDSAYLRYADLTEASLYEADLTSADLSGADLTGASLYEADLTGALLYDVDLTDATLALATLAGAYLRNARIANIKGWENIRDLRLADVYGVVSPPEGFLEWAVNEMGALCIEPNIKYLTLRDSLLIVAARRGQRPGRLQPDNIPIAY